MTRANRRPTRLRYLPPALGALLILVAWVYLLWNTTVGLAVPRLYLRNHNTVAGVVRDVARESRWADVWSGQAQHRISQQIAEITPLFGLAVRLNAQLYYSVFHKSPLKLMGSDGLAGILVMPGGDLFQWPYISEYCGRDLARSLPDIEAGASDIRRLQDWATGQGKTFLYIVTPSKAAVLASRLPSSLRCPATQADRVGKLPAFDRALAQAGVHAFDAATLIARAQGQAGIDLFARGSAHWTELAAAMAAREVTDALNAAAPPDGWRLTPFTLSWDPSFQPRGIDRELIQTMHLIWPEDHYPVPIVRYTAPPPATCHPARITEVGGSFMFRLNTVLSLQSCPPVIRQWFYWSKARVSYPGETWEKPDDAQRARDLADADIIIAEENEAVLPRSPHLSTWLKALPP